MESWPRAKVLAGLTTHDRVTLGPGAVSYSEAELIEAVAACARALGHLPGRGEYAAWRQAELGRLREREPWARLPSDAALRLRLPRRRQDWPGVIEIVLERRPDLRPMAARSGSGGGVRQDSQRQERSRPAGEAGEAGAAGARPGTGRASEDRR